LETELRCHIHLAGDMSNNKMERMNGEIRDREKVTRNHEDGYTHPFRSSTTTLDRIRR
jgi:hypothetical protein